MRNSDIVQRHRAATTQTEVPHKTRKLKPESLDNLCSGSGAGWPPPAPSAEPTYPASSKTDTAAGADTVPNSWAAKAVAEETANSTVPQRERPP